jgi:hypothetical protein
MVLRHMVSNAIAHIPSISEILCYIIGKLRLEEIYLPTLAIPLHDVLQSVFCCKTVHDHVVTLNLGRMLAWVGPTAHQATTLHVIGTPQPQIVANH